MRFVGRLLTLPLLVAALGFLALALTTPASLAGLGYAGALVMAGAAGMFGDATVRRRLLTGALSLALVTAGLRVALAGHGRHLDMGHGSASGARWIDRVVDEEDLAVNGARALVWTGLVRDPDVPGLADAMRDAYGRMRRSEGSTPSPVLATYAGLERPGEDDTIEVGDVARSEGVVVFLHGYAGSFTLPCWVVSQAAADARFATVCPSTRWVGDWWSEEGEATVRETAQALRRRGARRLVLAGLSNGAIGASRLAPRLRGTFDGLILVSGADADAPAPSVPVLAIQGAKDAQISASVVHAYAERVGGRYLSIDAGHFALLSREEEVRPAIATFLRRAPLAAATAARRAPRAEPR